MFSLAPRDPGDVKLEPPPLNETSALKKSAQAVFSLLACMDIKQAVSVERPSQRWQQLRRWQVLQEGFFFFFDESLTPS